MLWDNGKNLYLCTAKNQKLSIMQTTIILADNQDITRIGIQALLTKVGGDKYPQERVETIDELESVMSRLCRRSSSVLSSVVWTIVV